MIGMTDEGDGDGNCNGDDGHRDHEDDGGAGDYECGAGDFMFRLHEESYQNK